MLAVMLLLSCCGVIVGNENPIPGHRPRTLDQAVGEAKAKGQTETTLPRWIPGDRAFEGLYEAVADYSLVRAVLEEKRTLASGGHLNSYLRFEEIAKLAGPPPGLLPMPDHVPADLHHISGREFILIAPMDGEMVVQGVRVKSGNDTLEEFVIGRQYLLFVYCSGPEIGSLPFGLSGVFEVTDGKRLVPLRANGDVASAFRGASLSSVSDVDAYYKQHVAQPDAGRPVR
jgi:hypothetical protein